LDFAQAPANEVGALQDQDAQRTTHIYIGGVLQQTALKL
jgi:hypothetical protein